MPVCGASNCTVYLYSLINKIIIIAKDRTTDMGIQGKSIFGGPHSKLRVWLVDKSDYSCKMVDWIRLNGFVLTQQCTRNIACIVGTVYIFNLNYNSKTK